MNLEEMNRIKEERGYSFAQLSLYTGLPAVTLQKVFSGNSKNPRRSTLAAIERVLLGDEKVYGGRAYNYEEAGKRNHEMVLAESSAYHHGSDPVYGSSAPKMQEKRQGEYTTEDYARLPDEKRMELIDGALYDMSSPEVVHQDCLAIIHMSLYSWIREKKGDCKVFEAPVDVRLDADDRTMVVPDLVVVCDRNKIKKKEICGAPDFILEILSPSTRRRDLTLKLSKYAEAGVREYWILDPKQEKLITYNFMEENWIPRIRNLEGNAEPAIFNGECKINLDEIADSIHEFG